jgi:hypothetical protein
MIKRAGFALAVAGLMGGFAATPAVAGEPSPFVVGVWKLIQKEKGKGRPVEVDTEVRFINPTQLTVTLEYAFFELDGTFCGCDRDMFQPNKTTIYTMSDETTTLSPLNKVVFTCKGDSGALKSIVFVNATPTLNQPGHEDIVLGDASQVGFTTHVFGDVNEDPVSHFLRGKVMTEAGMQPVPIYTGTTGGTAAEVQAIHDLCVMVNGLITSPPM